MNIRIICLLLTSVVMLSGCLTGPTKLEDALALDINHFKSTMNIKDDEFEPIVVFSTLKGLQGKQGLLGVVGTDEFLRGFLDKRTGQKSYQVYVNFRHRAGQWLFPYQANYGRPLMTTKVDRIGSDVDCTGSRYSGCSYRETIVFSVPEKEFRRVQENATPADFKTKAWKFKVKTKAGEDYLSAILLPEVIALMDAMDEYQPVQMQQ